MDRRNFLKIGALAVAVGAIKVVPGAGAGIGMGPAAAAAVEGAGGLRLDLAAEPTSEGGVLTLLRVHNGTDSAVEQGTELHLVARLLDGAGLVGGVAWEPSEPFASSTSPGEGRWVIALPEAVAPGETAEMPLTWTYGGGSGLGSSGAAGRAQVFASLVVESDPYHEVQSPEVLVEV